MLTTSVPNVRETRGPPRPLEYRLIQSVALFATVWPENYGGRRSSKVENGTNQTLDPTFLSGFYKHHRPTLHRLGAVHFCCRQTDGQTLSSQQLSTLRFALKLMSYTMGRILDKSLVETRISTSGSSKCIKTGIFVRQANLVISVKQSMFENVSLRSRSKLQNQVVSRPEIFI